MNRKELIFKRVKEHLNYLKENHPDYNVIYIALQGSQNYNLDTYTEEYMSDVDTKAIVIPSLKEISLNKKPISTTILIPTEIIKNEYVIETEDKDENNIGDIGVYCIRNLINNKVYIGSSKRLKVRIKEHEYKINNNKHPNNKLNQDVLNGDTFEFIILEECNESELLIKEQYWIDYFGGIHNDNVYNETTSDYKDKTEDYLNKISIGNKGKIISKEQRDIISKALKGRKDTQGYLNGMFGKHHTEETKQKISKKQKENISKNGHPKGMLGKTAWNKGIPRSEETKLKISNKNKGNQSWLGKHHTEETKQKISKSKLGKPGAMKGTVYVNKNNKNYRVKKQELNNYINNGYNLGMIKKVNK